MLFRQALFLLCIFVASTNSSLALALKTPLEQGVALHFKGDLDAAYARLQKVNPESTEYKYAFIEMQKIHYRQKRWDRFFGFAQFYRKKLLSEFFDPDLLLLETLALIKHCQFNTVFNLIEFGKSLAQTLKSEPIDNPTLKALWNTELKNHHHSQTFFNTELSTFQTRLQSIQDLLVLQKLLPAPIQTTPVENKTKAFDTRLEWPIHSEQRTAVIKNAITNPNSIRVFVKNECGKPS